MNLCIRPPKAIADTFQAGAAADSLIKPHGTFRLDMNACLPTDPTEALAA